MPCKQCEGRARFGSIQLGGDKTVLQQIHVKTPYYPTEWTLTTYLGYELPSFLRLRFGFDYLESYRNPDTSAYMKFEVRLSDYSMYGVLRSTSLEVRTPDLGPFEVLGSDDRVTPYWFTREGREFDLGVGRRCICNFPERYRDEFVDMVAYVGELRRLVLFG
jgi:hypothetical protein